MSERNTLAHALHDLGLAAWFGGSLMGAIGVNGAAADVDDPRQRARVANAGWARWTPFNAVAIGAHLVGGAQLLKANKGRVATQKGVLANTNVKMALTAGALAATGYARVLGKKMQKAGDVPVAGGTNSAADHAARGRQGAEAAQRAAVGDPRPDRRDARRRPRCTRSSSARSQVLGGTIKGLPSAVGTAATGAALAAKHKVQDVL